MSEPFDPYAVLELAPTATMADIEAAYHRLQALLADGQLAAYGMLLPEEVVAQREELAAAYGLIGTLERRTAFDAGRQRASAAISLGPGPGAGARAGPSRSRAHDLPAGGHRPWAGAPAIERPVDQAAIAGEPPATATGSVRQDGPAPAPGQAFASALLRELPDEAQFNGPLLRRLRESAGASLDDICETTKISRRYVKAIEADDYGLLPAPAYVRGFVKAYAKLLGLEGKRVADSYLKTFSANGRRL